MINDDGTTAAVIDWTGQAARLLAGYGIAYTVRNPLEAMAIVSILSNPTLRGTAVEIARGGVRDAISTLKIVNRRVAQPALSGGLQYAIRTAKHPAFVGFVFIATTAAASTANQQMINRNTVALNPALQPALTMGMSDAQLQQQAWDSSPLMWSPFGGFQLGTAIS